MSVTFWHPGPPILVELKTGARLPDGSAVTLLGRYVEEPSGVTVIPLFAGVPLPDGFAAGTYAVEAALLELELGAHISRHSVPLALGP